MYFEDSLQEVSEECDDLLVEKQKDYGAQNILKFGEMGCLVRASDKLERLINLLQSKRTPSNESIEDSWKDLRNYAEIALMVRRGQFDLPLKDGENRVSLKKVFISHPYSDDPDGNKQRVSKIVSKIMKDYDILPISPVHLFSFMENDNGYREDIMEVTKHLIDLSDELWYFGWSEGVQEEVNYARENAGISIVEKSIHNI